MRWDIFCQIVDNYGDAGICWRLARSLTSLHDQKVRIFCNDLPILNLLASGVDDSITKKIDFQPWKASYDNARHPVITPEVVIEAFGCELPKRYLAGLLIASKKPIIINLEYLSAEPWVVDFHGRASPQAHGLAKYFFFPGFQDNTGGLLIDPIPTESIAAKKSIPLSLKATWSKLRAKTKIISVFCYPSAPLEKWLQDLSTIGEDVDVLLTYGQLEQLNLSIGNSIDLSPHIQLLSIPFVAQDEYDWVLSQCDFNIVRGEDSFIRAQLAGKPFIWHIYPQEDRAHEVKLAAFLDLYLESANESVRAACADAMHWKLPSYWINTLEAWSSHSKAWRALLLQKQGDGGLAARLTRFAA